MGNKILNIVTLLLCLIIAIAAMYIYLPDPYLWYDEAGQFWISQGLNHYSNPFAARGELLDVIVNNREFNKDPGGFSILLFLWTVLNGSPFFIRILPALFFLGFVSATYFVCKRELNDFRIAAIIATVFFVLPVFTNRVSELRAYPMEMMGTMLCLYFLMVFKDNLSYGRLFLLSLVQAFFCTSRYGFIIVAFCISLRVLYLLYKNNDVCDFIKKGLVYGVPLLIVVAFIFWGMMQFQSTGDTELEYANYILVSPRTLYSPLSLLFYTVIGLFVYKLRKRKKISELLIVSIIVGSSFFILSICGVFPWEMHRTISVYLLLVVSILVELAHFLDLRLRTKAVIPCLISLLLVSSLWIVLFDKLHVKETGNEIQEYVRYIDQYPDNTILVEMHNNPVIRYQYEYGILTDRCKKDDYPNHLLLQIGPKHNGTSTEHYGFDYISSSYDVLWCNNGIVPDGFSPIDGFSCFFICDCQ